jgi:hypothetical protein
LKITLKQGNRQHFISAESLPEAWLRLFKYGHNPDLVIQGVLYTINLALYISFSHKPKAKSAK